MDEYAAATSGGLDQPKRFADPGCNSCGLESHPDHAMHQQGDWFPANGGTETPTTTSAGRRLLYVWQPSTGDHAYLDLDTDLILSDAEVDTAFGR